jgi:membrane protein YdbS with pleckstrin-like domain
VICSHESRTRSNINARQIPGRGNENQMTDHPSELRTHYRFRDFLGYICLLAVPILTAILAIFRHSLFWTVAYVVIAAVMTVFILRQYCTHCPHYIRDEGSLTCIFFW